MAASLGEAPNYRDRCPLSWHPGATPGPDDAPERVLAAIAVIEESGTVANEDNDPVLAEIQNLDAKLRLLMDMVQTLYQQQAEQGPASEFVMSAEGIEITGEGKAPAAGEQGLIALHLDSYVARPLRLPAEVLGLETEGSRWTARLRFTIESEVLAGALEKHVFRRHRRAVAGARKDVAVT